MQDAKTYRQFADDCRRLAQTMAAAKDKHTLLDMAKAWEERAQEADKKARRTDGNGSDS